MRPPNQAARDQLRTVLARRAAASAADLATKLAVSVPTLHRLLQAHSADLVVTGKARRTRYALRRPLRGGQSDWPLVEINAQGGANPVAKLVLVQPEGSWLPLQGSAWPIPDDSRDGWWAGLPYILQDMRPQGYLGRQMARAEHAALGLPPNPEAWGDDAVVHALSHIGSDCSGNLLLGDVAFQRWQAQTLAPAAPLVAASLGAAYARLAQQAVAAGVAGSSAAGEFPKFPALRDLNGADTPHVLVKFSGADGSPAVQRWADLLVCEHLALGCAGTLPGVAAASSRIVQHAGRTFFEVQRFDRHGLHGRSPLVSLATLDACFVGDGSGDWPRLAAGLQALGLLDAATVQQVQHLAWFGRLIHNTDMHAGNLSFRPQAAAGAVAAATAPTSPPPVTAGPMQLAPAYDMLPMGHAPLPGGEVASRLFSPPLPLPAQRPVWLVACAAALLFWQRAAADTRISAAFRRVCAGHADVLQGLAQRV